MCKMSICLLYNFKEKWLVPILPHFLQLHWHSQSGLKLSTSLSHWALRNRAKLAQTSFLLKALTSLNLSSIDHVSSLFSGFLSSILNYSIISNNNSSKLCNVISAFSGFSSRFIPFCCFQGISVFIYHSQPITVEHNKNIAPMRGQLSANAMHLNSRKIWIGNHFSISLPISNDNLAFIIGFF